MKKEIQIGCQPCWTWLVRYTALFRLRQDRRGVYSRPCQWQASTSKHSAQGRTQADAYRNLMIEMNRKETGK